MSQDTPPPAAPVDSSPAPQQAPQTASVPEAADNTASVATATTNTDVGTAQADSTLAAEPLEAPPPAQLQADTPDSMLTPEALDESPTTAGGTDSLPMPDSTLDVEPLNPASAPPDTQPPVPDEPVLIGNDADTGDNGTEPAAPDRSIPDAGTEQPTDSPDAALAEADPADASPPSTDRSTPDTSGNPGAPVDTYQQDENRDLTTADSTSPADNADDASRAPDQGGPAASAADDNPAASRDKGGPHGTDRNGTHQGDDSAPPPSAPLDVPATDPVTGDGDGDTTGPATEVRDALVKAEQAVQAAGVEVGGTEKVWEIAAGSDTEKLEALRAGFTKDADGNPNRWTLPAATADPVEVTITFVPGMDPVGFAEKTDALKALSQAQLLYKAPNPVARGDATIGYRQAVIKAVHDQHSETDPELSKRVIKHIAGERKVAQPAAQPDHVWELQLGGPDTHPNLRFLHAFTNENIGLRQIRPQLQKLQDGTPITIRIEE